MDIFKIPKEPTKKCKSLTLDSLDGKALSGTKSLSRRSTQGSIATIATFETSPGPAFARIEARSPGAKSIKGLVIEFHDPSGTSFPISFQHARDLAHILGLPRNI